MQQMTNRITGITIPANPRDMSETKQAIHRNTTDRYKLEKSPPEALGQLLQTRVEKPEEENFERMENMRPSECMRTG